MHVWFRTAEKVLTKNGYEGRRGKKMVNLIRDLERNEKTPAHR
jgi:hypothetical protein